MNIYTPCKQENININQSPHRNWLWYYNYNFLNVLSVRRRGKVVWEVLLLPLEKAEHGRIDAFELWCWRRLLTVPWTARRSNQLILKELSPEYSLEGLMLKLKTPILWSCDMKSWLIGENLDAGKDRRWEKGMTEDEMVGWHHWLDGHEFDRTPGDGKGQQSLACCSPWHCKDSDTTEQQWWSHLICPWMKNATYWLLIWSVYHFL